MTKNTTKVGPEVAPHKTSENIKLTPEERSTKATGPKTESAKKRVDFGTVVVYEPSEYPTLRGNVRQDR